MGKEWVDLESWKEHCKPALVIRTVAWLLVHRLKAQQLPYPLPHAMHILSSLSNTATISLFSLDRYQAKKKRKSHNMCMMTMIKSISFFKVPTHQCIHGARSSWLIPEWSRAASQNGCQQETMVSLGEDLAENLEIGSDYLFQYLVVWFGHTYDRDLHPFQKLVIIPLLDHAQSPADQS
jgi:hypothetical protein